MLGATGTLGRLAVQVAKLLGAGRVIAAGRNPARLRRAAELGADACVALSADDAAASLREAAGPGIDVIIDLLWGAPAALALQATSTDARFIQVGNAAGLDAAIPAGVVRSKAAAILGYANYHVAREERHAAYSRLAEDAAAGRVDVDVERWSLEDVDVAWERQRTGAPCKLVLIPHGS